MDPRSPAPLNPRDHRLNGHIWRRAAGKRRGALLEALAAATADPDALAKRLGLSHAALARTLARLMISGDVRECGDGPFARR